jgi:ectoine hydroxylase-related dioxygenase (phytanoyl-CoA dioxygenase family)
MRAASLGAVLTQEQQARWDRDGFFVVEGFADAPVLDAMERCIVDLARADAAGSPIGPAYVMEETNLASEARQPEEQLAKLFRVHREHAVFRDFCCDDRLVSIIRGIRGSDIDCFLSQFIFKLPGALGQPWHQDSWYFPFDREPQLGAWLAVTEATERNGPLWVLPGSHKEPVHDVVADERENSLYGYVEIIDHDMSDETVVLMQPGDLLVFHSHLMHRSTDNLSDQKRAAMVYHYGMAGTVDRSEEKFGYKPRNQDWMAVSRSS